MASRSTRARPPRDVLERLSLDATSRFVDLKMLFVREKTGERLLEAGGRWDAVERCFLREEPRRCKVVTLSEAQLEATVAARDWLDARKHGRERFVELILDGGRGSGKSVLGVLITWAIDVELADSLSLLVSPANTRRAELEIIIGDHVPRSWRAWSERDLTYVLPNGSTATFVGADDEDGLKRGGYEVCLLNEAQLMTSQAYAHAAGGIRNVSGRGKGLLILARNPATKVRGEWTEDHIEKVESGLVNAKYFVLDPRKNQFLDKGVVDDVDALIRSVRPDIADADALGIRRRIGDMAAPAFKPFPREKGGHVGRAPDIGWREVTREITAKKTGRPSGYEVVVGVDFQQRPGCVGVVARLYERDDKRLSYVAEHVIVADDNEDDLARRIDAYLGRFGIDARNALVIADSTGSHQNAARSRATKPSHEIMREWYFTVVAPEKPKDPRNVTGVGRNPDVPDSLAQLYDVCEAGRLLVHPEADWLVESLRRCKVKKRGGSLRLDDSKPGYSHAVDCTRYITWYFEPRRGVVRPVPSRTAGRQVLGRRT